MNDDKKSMNDDKKIFFNIADLTELCGNGRLTDGENVMLAIAQQLSVISGHLRRFVEIVLKQDRILEKEIKIRDDFRRQVKVRHQRGRQL